MNSRHPDNEVNRCERDMYEHHLDAVQADRWPGPDLPPSCPPASANTELRAAAITHPTDGFSRYYGTRRSLESRQPFDQPDPPEQQPPTAAELDELARLDELKRFHGRPHEL